ncbi:uncharacterized protein [Palaemon carinicauda]|uniref:uncharacterized protein n=1 Tax=Palaemon carinicauda TaxID=392227 RepID=UPI0035B622DE
MKTLQIWGFILLLSVNTEAAGHKMYLWKNTGPNMRFTLDGSVMASFNYMSKALCGGECNKRSSCYSFNHGGPQRTCELLNTAPVLSGSAPVVSSIGWNFYTNINPRLCPPGAVLIPYEIPPNQDGPTVEGYTCSDNDYFLMELNSGKTECRLEFLSQKDVWYNDAQGYAGIMNPYHEAFRHCFINNCVEVACDGSLSTCWLKVKAAAQTTNPMKDNANRNYWRANCQ